MLLKNSKIQYMAWKNGQEDYLCDKKILMSWKYWGRVLVGSLTFIKKWVIQNELEWVMIRNIRCKYSRFSLDSERREKLQHGKKDMIGIRWSSMLKDSTLLSRKFITHNFIFLRVCKNLNNFSFFGFFPWALYMVNLGPRWREQMWVQDGSAILIQNVEFS